MYIHMCSAIIAVSPCPGNSLSLGLIHTLSLYSFCSMPDMPKQKTSLRKFMPYLLQYKTRIAVVMFFLIAGKVAAVAAPVYLKTVVDALQRSVTEIVPLQLVLMLVGLYFLVRVLSVLLGELKDYLFSKVETRIVRNVARDIFSHLIGLAMAFHLDKRTGSVANKIERGIGGIEFIFRFALFNILPNVVEIVLVSVYLFANYHWLFGLGTLLTLGAYIAFTIFIVERRSKANREVNVHSAEASGRSIDSLINIETVKVFGNDAWEIARYDESRAAVEKASLQSKNYLYMTNIGQGLILTIGVVGMLAFAAGFVLDKTMTIGDFMLITVFIGQISIPLGFLGSMYRMIKDSLINMEDMFDLISIPPVVTEKENAVAKKEIENEVAFDHVSFSYGEDRQILDDVDFKVPRGKVTALVGYSGSGKSSIAKLLLRLYDVSEGAIKIDDVDLRDLDFASLRSLIGIVPQDSVLFNDTIGYNIAYGRPDATQEEIENAARKANIHDFIASLPDGYDTKVGERGLRLSGGEKQRVAIARVIMKGCPILIFDEATSSLDSKSERMIQDAIEHLAEEKTLLIIAHRLSTIAQADQILVMDHGKLVERGTHAELLEHKGHYAALWKLQKEQKEKEVEVDISVEA